MIIWDTGKFAQKTSKFVENAGKIFKNASNFLGKKK